MKFQRFLGLVIAAALLIGCSREEKKAQPAAANPPPATKPAEAPKADTKKATPNELMAKAKEALAKGDGAAGIAALEELVAQDPQNREGLFLLSRALQVNGTEDIKRGNRKAAVEPLLKSAKYIKQLRAAYPKLTDQEAGELPGILYVEACVLSRTGEPDKAMDALEDAYKSGFADLNLLNADHDLDGLRKLPRFESLLQSATAKLGVKAKEP